MRGSGPALFLFVCVQCLAWGHGPESASFAPGGAQRPVQLALSETPTGYESPGLSAVGSREFMIGRIDQVPSHSRSVINEISGYLHERTGFGVFVNVVDSLPRHYRDADQQKSGFLLRRAYEDSITSTLARPYAVVFLYYGEHKISLVSSESFVDSAQLLERYAFPYLPAYGVGSSKYDDGINKGLSNVYLALVRDVASFYNVNLNLPRPLEKPSGVVRMVLIVMIVSLLGLFAAARFGIFRGR